MFRNNLLSYRTSVFNRLFTSPQFNIKPQPLLKQFGTKPHTKISVRKRHYNTKPPIEIASTGRGGPSLRLSLTLLLGTLTGVFSYCTYKVGYCHEAVFLPLWISAKQRSPYKSEVDKEAFVKSILSKLHARLSVDEEVNSLLGVALEFVEDDPDDKFELYVRSSGPGITGIMIEPYSWKTSFTSRPFASFSSGIDRILQPFAPGQADSEDASSFPSRNTSEGPSFYEAVLEGRIRVRSCSKMPDQWSHHHSIDEGIIEFRAARSLSHANASPRFSNTVLKYIDGDGHEVIKRLW